MTEVEKAFDLATRLIADATASGATRLDLSQPGTRALERLPDSIADLEMLEELHCADT
ncbi:hypothetical protein [Tateyamaria sp. SN6-1]|uniref:hypothetical protein n=1 Tax=Tateyamaria sp. SN6-1 TaxID=3092148 RepID=UPI0039F5F131